MLQLPVSLWHMFTLAVDILNEYDLVTKHIKNVYQCKGEKGDAVIVINFIHINNKVRWSISIINVSRSMCNERYVKED